MTSFLDQRLDASLGTFEPFSFSKSGRRPEAFIKPHDSRFSGTPGEARLLFIGDDNQNMTKALGLN